MPIADPGDDGKPDGRIKAKYLKGYSPYFTKGESYRILVGPVQWQKPMVTMYEPIKIEFETYDQFKKSWKVEG